MGAQKNHLNEMVLLSTHNICFGWEILKKIYFFKIHTYLEACIRKTENFKSYTVRVTTEKLFETVLLITHFKFGISIAES